MTTKTLLTDFDAVLADLDGVVYAGPNAIPGAIEALNALAAIDVKLAYVTNNASRTPAQVAAHLRELGAPAADDQVVSSAQAGAALLAQKFPEGSKVLVTGSSALAQEVESLGMKVVESALDAPDVVIQGFDPTLGWADLAEASYAINAGALWIATNTDMTIPRDRGIAPGNGSLVAVVRAAVDHDPLVAGKPEAPLFYTAANRLGATSPLVVGDRLDTDILGGNNAGMATALVLTGVDSGETALRACTAQRPGFIIPTLADFFLPYPQIKHDGATVTCGAAAATVELAESGESMVHIAGTPEDVDAWRAACAAWWAVVPDTTSATDPILSWGSTLP
ncbi:haloacid dehalogenase [Arthrobacter psychrolactophilus]|uniref:Haloacid dehalogenase n=1 Tax=Arthrobacter psychrolactophilus TaxID=92442 RepID=A0A2V5JFT9_9MICC|nr:HAD-IIA family hydrolase [Arthrobacter psychrolactophilus]PYI38527.1 haloacid dehalogenase [Arthrobacter psychrolactophilus]